MMSPGCCPRRTREYTPRGEPFPGTRLGPYEVVSRLGAGGMGEVYSARDTRLERHVALKLVLDAFVADPERTRRFEQEARTLASLNHPGIASLHGIEHIDGRHLLVMELVDGVTLEERSLKVAVKNKSAFKIKYTPAVCKINVQATAEAAAKCEGKASADVGATCSGTCARSKASSTWTKTSAAIRRTRSFSFTTTIATSWACCAFARRSPAACRVWQAR